MQKKISNYLFKNISITGVYNSQKKTLTVIKTLSAMFAKTRIVRRSDYSRAIVLSEEKTYYELEIEETEKKEN